MVAELPEPRETGDDGIQCGPFVSMTAIFLLISFFLVLMGGGLMTIAFVRMNGGGKILAAVICWLACALLPALIESAILWLSSKPGSVADRVEAQCGIVLGALLGSGFGTAILMTFGFSR